MLYRLSEGMFYSLKFSLFSRIFRGFAGFCEDFEQNQDCAISVTIQNNIDGQNKKNAPFSVRSCIWWKVVDSNHRSHRRQIYSLFPLATRETFRIQLAEKVELVDGLEPPTC